MHTSTIHADTMVYRKRAKGDLQTSLPLRSTQRVSLWSEQVQQAFLETISETVFASFHKTLTLQKIAKLIVPRLADYCRIAIVNEDNTIAEIAVGHKDPTKIDLVSHLYNSYKDRPSNTHGIMHILQTGKAEIIEKLTEETYKTIADDEQLLKILKDIGLRSYMGVPLIARRKVIGAIVFSSVTPQRYYTRKDLSFAKEVSRRIAIALDNFRLYQKAQEEIIVRKRVEEILLAHQQQLEMTQKTVRVGIFEWNLRTNDLFLTPNNNEVFGFMGERAERNFENFFALIHRDDQKKVMREIKTAIKKRSEFTSEFRVTYPDTTMHWISVRGKFFFDAKNKPLRMMGIAINIDKEKQRENNTRFFAEASKVLGSSLDYQTTLSNVAKLAVPAIADWCTVQILDQQGYIQQVAVAHKDPKKVAWAKQFALRSPRKKMDFTAVVGVPHVIRTGMPELYPHVTDAMLVAAAKNKKDLALLRSLQLNSVMIVPLLVGKSAIGTISFVTSETQRAFGNSDLFMAQELAHRASLAIENAALYQQSQAAITLRDDFISVASHELKTPITSVKIFTQVLQRHFKQQGDEQAILYLEKMDKQINKLTDLIYNLLNISKIQAGRLEYKQQMFMLDTLVHDVVEAISPSFAHRIIIRGKTGKPVWGDEDRIGQVLSNLISNAVKYSPKAKRIIISLASNTEFLTVGVRDFGIGIAKQHLSKIFERFYRASDTNYRTFPGLGIGLYISREIIRRHGGKLWVESEVDKGSTFYFSLPLRKMRR